MNESAAAWYARAVHDLQIALVEENGHWLRLVKDQSVADGLPIVDDAYLNAVDRADHAQYEVFHAARAWSMEQAN